MMVIWTYRISGVHNKLVKNTDWNTSNCVRSVFLLSLRSSLNFLSHPLCFLHFPISMVEALNHFYVKSTPLKIFLIMVMYLVAKFSQYFVVPMLLGLSASTWYCWSFVIKLFTSPTFSNHAWIFLKFLVPLSQWSWERFLLLLPSYVLSSP